MFHNHMLLTSQAFSPLALFASGEQGVWYDPSDFSTMFQDVAGTTPVTAVEQPVGLILDKSGRGNHASQSTSASRPVLSARVNLLTRTEEFNNAAWAKSNSSITATNGIAPNGTATADTLTENTATSGHGLTQGFTTAASTAYTFSVYARANGRSSIDLVTATGFTINPVVRFTLSGSGASATRQGNPSPTHSIESVGSGWYLCRINVTTVAGGSTTFGVNLVSDDAGSSFYTGDGTSGILIWGADLRLTNQTTNLPAYQRVVTATDYDTTGFPMYLKFDGTDDGMATATINPGSVDKVQVFAGVRKLSDAARGMLVELSASTASNNGSFHLEAPSAAGIDNFYWRSKGTLLADVNAVGFAAPTTRVLTGLSDIAGDISRFRVNATQVGAATTDQGTGNYLSYPLYIGRRGGSTLPFNGNLYQLIVRFSAANLPNATIAQTETWVNGKTGAF